MQYQYKNCQMQNVRMKLIKTKSLVFHNISQKSKWNVGVSVVGYLLNFWLSHVHCIDDGDNVTNELA